MSELTYVELVAAYRDELRDRFPWLDPFRLGIHADRWARTELANRFEDKAGLIQSRGRLAAISYAKEEWARSIEDTIAALEAEGQDRAVHSEEDGEFSRRVAAVRAESERPVRCAATFRLLYDIAALRPTPAADRRLWTMHSWAEAVVSAGLMHDVDGSSRLRAGVTDREIARALVDAGLVRPWSRDGEDELGEPLPDPSPRPRGMVPRDALQVGTRPLALNAGPDWDLPPEWRDGTGQPNGDS